DRRRPFVIGGTVAALPFLVVFGWAPGLALVMLGYAGMQIALNVAQAAFQAFIPDLVPREERGVVSGAKNLLSVVGAAVGLLGARGLLALGFGTGAVLAFLAAALLTTAVLTWVWVPVPPRPSKPRQPLLKALDPRRLWSSSVETFRRHRTFRYAVIAQFLFMLGTYPAQRFLLFLLEDRFGDENAVQRASVGLVAAIVCAAIAAGFAGAISDHTGRLPVLYATVVCGVAGMVGIGVAPTPLLVGAFGVILAIGVGAFQAVNWALLSDDMPEGEGARAFGLANIATAGAGALAGLFGPMVDVVDLVLPDGAYGLTFGLAALFVLASVLPLRRVDEMGGTEDRRNVTGTSSKPTRDGRRRRAAESA
ncbi:MAG TPA: MFS transporter, partial [Thermomicrobiales bacterium]|nr:MFS transporter [Thermomicrobiales bacterium]